ncbi:MAG: hypothetical protein LBS11_00670, partial [Oscillospiraceae bacterium]|nr:hypothetical protein [Oscillospiraceae bacterium]
MARERQRAGARPPIRLIRSAVDAIKRLTWDADKRDEYKTLHRAETLLGEAMDAAAVGRGEDTSRGVQFSVQEDAQGRYVFVDVDQARFDGLTTNEEFRREATAVITERFQGQTIGRADNASIVNTKAKGEYVRGPSSSTVYQNLDSKMRLSAELDNVMEIARFLRHDKDHKSHGAFAARGFDYYTAPFEVAGRRFIGEFVVANRADGTRVFYGMPHMQIAANSTNSADSGSARASAIGFTGSTPALLGDGPAVVGTPEQDQVSSTVGLPTPATDTSISQRGGDVQYSIPGETSSQRRKLDALRKKFGTMEPGRNLETGAVLLPKRTDDESAVSQTVRTIMETGRLAESLSPEFLDGVIAGKYSHKVQGDAQARKFAENALGQGLLEARGKWDYAMASNRINKNMIVLGQELLKEYARIGDKQGAADIVGDLTFTLTETGQRLQAMTLLKNSGAVGSSMYYSKLVKQIN